MNSFFNYDGPFFTVLNRISDLVVLNMVYLLCCIPIVTIGAATTALYYETIRIVNQEDAGVVKNFFKSFRQNFRQSTIMWLIMLLFGAMVGFDLYLAFYVDFGFNSIILPVVFLVTLIYFMILVYLFPLQSRFENKIKYTFKNALILSIRHLPYTILFIAALAGGVFLFCKFFVVMLLVYILIGFSAIAYALSFAYNKIFNIYIKKDEVRPVIDESGNDWHIPEEYDDVRSDNDNQPNTPVED